MNDNLNIAYIRGLALDMIDTAASGHPGMALSAAPIIHTVYTRHLKADPKNPTWPFRDRFVLSSGHASALLYSTLHIAGYNLPIDELKRFRQLHSLTPGHPELGLTDGVDVSTGPLGQGIANAVGIAINEAHIRAMYPSLKNITSYYTYALCGDGCLEEGIAMEAMSIASSLKLSKLIIIYDNNDVTLDGPLAQSANENLLEKFNAMGFNTILVDDGNDVEKIDKAIISCKKQDEKPSIIIVKTIIGYGSKNQGTCKVHGSPLGFEESLNTKKFLGLEGKMFYVSDETYKDYQMTFAKRGHDAYLNYINDISNLTNDDSLIFNHLLNGNILKDVSKYLPVYKSGAKATRISSGEVLEAISLHTDLLIGGAADVASSTKTLVKEKGIFNSSNFAGQNINFGIREHAMFAICNGIATCRIFKPYASTFLAFSQYGMGAIRCAALMKLPVTYIFTHDSLAVGEDGPTHQPIEQTNQLRLIPNVNVIRPCDANEVVGAYKVAFSSKDSPTALILTRQDLALQKLSSADKVKKGAYVISYEKNNLDAIIIATGSEVNMAIEAQKRLLRSGIDVRVVSMPSMYLFEKQSKKYKKEVLPLCKCKTIAVELGSGALFYKYAKTVMSYDDFGISAPFNEILNDIKFNTNTLVKLTKKALKDRH